MDKLGKYLFGLFFVVLGIGFLLDEFVEGVDIGQFFAYFWPLIFVFIGVNLLRSGRDGTVFGIFMIILGLLWIASNFIEFDIWKLWPLILVAIGVSIIFSKDDTKKSTDSFNKIESNRINEFIAFWGAEKKYISKDFTGGEINVVFGGAEYDLSEVSFEAETISIDVNALFGGVEIKVPNNVLIEVRGSGILGAFENKIASKNSDSNTSKKLIITGNAFFGAVEIF